METTFEPSLPDLRNKITAIEAIELSMLGFGFWSLVAFLSPSTPDTSLFDLIMFLVITEAFLLGSWAIYNAYIRIARECMSRVDIGLRILAAGATGTYTLWAWIMLDINRFLMSKLFYRGEAPVEYAWSVRSKQRRWQWEKARKAASA